MSCELIRKKRKRKNRVSTLLPLEYRNISKKRFKELSFDRAYRFYAIAHGIDLENHNFRKVIYDAIFDALENRNGKIHRKDYLNEIEKFYNRYYQVVPTESRAKISDWENYRNSTQYQEFLKYVKQVERLDHRADITVSNALSYLHATKQNKNLIYKTVDDLERTLGLDYIPELWSKSFLWFGVNVLFFHQISFMLKVWKIPVVFDITKLVVMDHVDDFVIDLKVSKDWYEWDFYYDMDAKDKALWYIYDNVIVPTVGETGSVLLAEALRAGTCFALHFAAKTLWTLARFHPAFRVLGVSAYLAEGLKEVLDKSVLAWLGWQIAVEWSLDGYIQMTMKRIGEALYRVVHGEEFSKAWKFAILSSEERYELIEKYFNLYKDILQNIVNYYKADKPVQLRDRIVSQIEEFAKMGIDLGVQERTTKLINYIRNIIKLFEAKWQLYQFYRHAKSEIDLLKYYVSTDIKNYEQKTYQYLQDGTEKSKRAAINALLELVQDSAELASTYTFAKAAEAAFRIPEPDTIIYAKNLLEGVKNTINLNLKYAIDKIAKFAESKKETYEEILYEHYDFHRNVQYNPYLEVEYYTRLVAVGRVRFWSMFKDFSELAVSFDEGIQDAELVLDWEIYIGREGYYLLASHFQNLFFTFPTRLVLIHPALRDIVKTSSEMNNLLFGYLNLFEDAINLLRAMRNVYCFSRDRVNYVPVTVARSGQLRYNLRNRCFSVKQAKKTIKKLINADIIEEIYNRAVTKKIETIALSCFEHALFEHVDSLVEISFANNPARSFESAFEKLALKLFAVNNSVDFTAIDNKSFDLNFNSHFWAYSDKNREILMNKAGSFEHKMRIYLLPSANCTSLKNLFRKSKRSKVICFI